MKFTTMHIMYVTNSHLKKIKSDYMHFYISCYKYGLCKISATKDSVDPNFACSGPSQSRAHSCRLRKVGRRRPPNVGSAAAPRKAIKTTIFLWQDKGPAK